jgi:CRP/FNR family transcriptional regulator, cyclic AMP receptor protein
MTTIAFSGRSPERRAGAAAPPRPAPSPFQRRRDVVCVFQRDPDLLAGLDADTVELLRRRAVAARLRVEPGSWKPPTAEERSGASLGLLVVEGAFIRTIEVQGRRCHELVGAGDVLRPWDDVASSVAQAPSWRALEPASLAVLDERFAAVAARWPSVMAALLERGVQRSRRLAINLALVAERRADVRMLMLLWHLADRWGRVTGDGLHLPLRLTHEILGDLASVRRPTASSALNALARDGEVVRRDDGSWLLTGSPPARAGRPAARSAPAAPTA